MKIYKNSTGYQDSAGTFELRQVTKETFSDPHPNPTHFIGATYDPVEQEVYMEDVFGTERVAGIGDWIVRNNKMGSLIVVNELIFQITFEIVEEVNHGD